MREEIMQGIKPLAKKWLGGMALPWFGNEPRGLLGTTTDG